VYSIVGQEPTSQTFDFLEGGHNMATVNFTSSKNNANFVSWTLGTKLERLSDRDGVTVTRGGLISVISNLGVGVTAANPFTILG